MTINIDTQEDLLDFISNNANIKTDMTTISYTYTQIDLSYNTLTNDMILLLNKIFSNFGNNINTLYLEECNLTTKSVTNLFKDVELFNLSSLVLGGNDLSQTIETSFLTNQTNLTDLYLDKCKLTTESVTNLFKDIELSNITILNLLSKIYC